MKIKSPSRQVSRAAKQQNAKTNAAGRKLMAALDEIIAAERGQHATLLIKRTIVIPEPRTYLPRDVKIARQKLGISQRVFSSLLGVSVELVENWEQGHRVPALWARRLLDEVMRDPGHWKSMMRRSA